MLSSTHLQLKHKTQWQYDSWLLIVTICLVSIGVVMVASASMVISDKMYGYPFHFLLRQMFYLVLGVPLAMVAAWVPSRVWQKYAKHLLFITLFLLAAVLVPGIGHMVNGSRRWLGFGFISLQVSELAKLAMIIYMADYLQRYQAQVRSKLEAFIKPLVILFLIAVLLLREPDFGALTVITLTVLTLLFLSEVKLWPFAVLLAIVIVALGLLAVISPYRLARITAFLNPWANQYGSGYQLTQSLIAFGRGGVFGVGLGNSVQKLFYLPEAHTDFMFAVLAEELGLIGEVFVVGLFALLVGRIMYFGRLAQQKQMLFQSFVAFGIGTWFAIQAIVNMGVNAGMLPTKGLTLPFISYGGSSMLINCIVIGLLLRIAYEIKTGDLGDGEGLKKQNPRIKRQSSMMTKY